MRKRERGEQGYVLIVTAITLTILLGMAGLAVDVGRMYVIKSELQAFADSASLAAAMEMDGTRAGVERSGKAASSLAAGEHAMKWDMGSREITDIKLLFAKGAETPDEKTWKESPSAPADSRFVKVIVTAPAPLTFLRIFQGADSSLVAAAGVASAQPARLVE